MSESIRNILKGKGIIAVLEIEDADDAVPVCQALYRGGVQAIELALRTKAAEHSIELIKENVPEMCLGIGTVIKPGQAKRVKELGADFAVSPGYNQLIVDEARGVDLPFAPGIATPSELEKAITSGFDTVKLFPAVPVGGVSYLKSMNGPYAYLGIKYIPLGGVSLDNLKDWAECSDILSIGGTWIAKKPLIRAKNFDQIEKNASEAALLWKKYKKEEL